MSVINDRCLRLLGASCGVLVVLWGGCKSTNIAMEDPFFEKWQSIKRQSRLADVEFNAENELPEVYADEDQVLTPLSPSEAADQRLPTTIVKDLSLSEKTEVAVVLRTLAEAGGQNILIGEGVTQLVEVRFADVPWNEAFKSILSTAALSYEWEGDIIRVMSLADMQKELEIARIKQESHALQAATRQVEPMHVRMVRIKFSNAEKLAALVGEILEGKSLAAGPRASVSVDVDSNTIVVHAIKSELDKISHLIARLDRAKPQVLIESKIVETNRSTARELGMQWGGGFQSVGGDRLHRVSAAGLGGYGVNVPAALDDGFGASIGYAVERLGGGDFLELQLTALQEDGKINILSSPSITTLDNETAIIEAGEERAYRETSGTGNDLDVSIEWKTATLKLEVTPHVIDASMLKLDVLVNKDSFDETKPASSGEFPVNTKKAKTTLLLRNGETTVIGGLSQESTSDAVRGVPFLKDIPLLGLLFRSRGTGTQFDEIMIFITPQVLLDKAQLASQVKPMPEESKSDETAQ